MASIIFITHPEVVIDPQMPVPDWPLSQKGRQRMDAFVNDPVLGRVSAVYSSGERKAMDGAAILAAHLGVSHRVEKTLHENDRSATGFIAPPEFWEVVHRFFSRPHESVRGWERAIDAQSRIVGAVQSIAQHCDGPGDIAIVSHGGVGSLLLAYLSGTEMALPFAQPHGGGGCYFVIDREGFTLVEGWHVMDMAGQAAARA
jgi:broad specificity phosphatase PhoE